MKVFYNKIPKDVLNELPLKSFEGKINVLESQEDVYEASKKLLKEKILGFDTETKPVFKKGVTHKVDLLQLATSSEAFLFKLDKTGLPKALLKILEDEEIIKAGVAIHDDLKALKKIKYFKPGGFVELQTFSDEFGIEDNGLKKLTGNLLGFRISKGARLTDWSNDTYTDTQLKYAATDAWVSYEIYKTLIALNGDYKINMIN